MPNMERPCPRLLVIDDDVHYGAFLKSYLGRLGFPVQVVLSGGSAAETCRAFRADIVLLDWSKGNAAPVVVITGKDRTSDDEAGIWRAGADYFMSKLEIADSVRDSDAFARRMNDLLARARKPTPAARLQAAGTIERGRVRVDIDARRVWVEGAAKRLTPRRFELLRILIHDHEGVSCEWLAAQGWDPSSLRKTVQRLKDDLGLRDGIIAVGRGYKLVG
jgi:DNA-binding response OmpR family regulator